MQYISCVIMFSAMLVLSTASYGEEMYIGANPYASDSTANPYGAGNRYHGDGINNPYGGGNPYRSDSWKNPYATESNIRVRDRD